MVLRVISIETKDRNTTEYIWPYSHTYFVPGAKTNAAPPGKTEKKLSIINKINQKVGFFLLPVLLKEIVGSFKLSCCVVAILNHKN